MRKEAFDQVNSMQLLRAINNYHETLNELNLVADHSLSLINQLKTNPRVLAIKGCGALGADVLLVLTSTNDALAMRDMLHSHNWNLLATEKNITNINKNT